jgi:hypothetical protein
MKAVTEPRESEGGIELRMRTAASPAIIAENIHSQLATWQLF